MDKKLRETTNLGVEIMNIKIQVKRCLTSPFLTFSFLQPVGCDYKIGSGTAYDRCGVCNGDSTTCTPVTVTFTEDWKVRGE